MCEDELSRYKDVDRWSVGFGDKMGSSKKKKVEEGVRVLLHRVLDDEYFVLAPDTDRCNESRGEYCFDDRLNGRDRFPGTVQGEVHVFAEPIADEMRHMVVDARAACAQRNSREDCKNVFLRLSWSALVTLCNCQVVIVLSQAFCSSFVGCKSFCG